MSPVRRYRVTGRVQGVGFRAFVVRLGRDSGVRGAVRNEHDGSVVAVGVGSAGALDSFRGGLERGPRAAQVWAVDEQELAALPEDERFDGTF